MAVKLLEHDKPKYQQLKEYLVNLIESNALPGGSKIPSENELAESSLSAGIL